MVSRVKSLDGLMVLRPFCQSKITCHLQQDVRDELKRQRLLELATLAQHGKGEIAETAAREIAKLSLDELLDSERSHLDLDNSNLNTLLRSEQHVTDQLCRLTRDVPSSLRKRPTNASTSQPKRRKKNDKAGAYSVMFRAILTTLFSNFAIKFTSANSKEPVHL